MNKEPFVLGTAITSTARRAVKTPANNVARKILSKAPSHTNAQPTRVKPCAPPPPEKDAELPACSLISTGDQSLDFSLLHTMKNVYGQIKVIQSIESISRIVEFRFSHLLRIHHFIRKSKPLIIPLVNVNPNDDRNEHLFQSWPVSLPITTKP